MSPIKMELAGLQVPSPITVCQSDFLQQHHITLHIKRDDLIHPQLQGNKWRKLKYNLREAQRLNKQTLLTFGGAYSNHIHATAAAGKIFDFNTIGIIRGEAYTPLNPTLQDAYDWGMQLKYINRADYKHKNSPEFLAQLKEQYGDIYIIPEGGNNRLAMQGCAEINNEIEDYDVICIACGTGTSLAGMISSAKQQTQLMGFSVLKSADFLISDVKNLLAKSQAKKLADWSINLDYHFGGYAKKNTELINFIDNFKQTYEVQLEPIYTGKMMWGLFDLIQKNYFPKNSKILAIHSGGLQGLRGLKLSTRALCAK